MNADAIGELAFKSIPPGLKGIVRFTRTTVTGYDPLTGTSGSSVVQAVAEAVITGARGTGTESFADALAIREKYLRLVVRAKQLGSFRPQSGDVAFVSGESFRVVGVEAVSPNGATVAIYNVTVER